MALPDIQPKSIIFVLWLIRRICVSDSASLVSIIYILIIYIFIRQ